MHDPFTLAHEIRWPWKNKYGINSPILTIWHKDPERHGSDDSCGWFKRSHHGDSTVLKEIRKEMDFCFDSVFKSDESGTTYYTGFFSPKSGMPNFSPMAITLNLFYTAAWVVFKRNRKKANRWMQNNLFDILHFAENPTDSLRDEINGTFRIGTGTEWNRNEALNHYSSIIYGYLLRRTTPWYKHPRWHIHHWRFQFHPYQQLKRRIWDKCEGCRKRGFKSAAYSVNGKMYHYECQPYNAIASPK